MTNYTRKRPFSLHTALLQMSVKGLSQLLGEPYYLRITEDAKSLFHGSTLSWYYNFNGGLIMQLSDLFSKIRGLGVRMKSRFMQFSQKFDFREKTLSTLRTAIEVCNFGGLKTRLTVILYLFQTYFQTY